MMSKDGTSTNTTANLQPVTKLVAIENVSLVNSASLLPQRLQNSLSSDLSSPVSPSRYVTSVPNTLADFTLGGVRFNSDFILFTPQGEIVASATADNFVPQMMVGLTEAKGTTVLSPTAAHDGAVVVVSGGGGQIRIVRL
jgi:hypothetical protein